MVGDGVSDRGVEGRRVELELGALAYGNNVVCPGLGERREKRQRQERERQRRQHLEPALRIGAS